jgi:DNA polymerase III subunit epsilon
MREIILDTETTGLDPAKGDRLVEIGAIELFNHLPTGETFHRFINPERSVPAEAVAVHGLTTEFLKLQPVFASIVGEFLAFIGDVPLVIHNAAFDVGFLNAELAYLDRGPILPARVIDTLQLARRKFPMGSNSLDALCRRFGVDNSRRTKHGALLDSELLAEVYLELIGGRQTALTLLNLPKTRTGIPSRATSTARSRPVALPPRLTTDEIAAHAEHVSGLGPNALWRNPDPTG